MYIHNSFMDQSTNTFDMHIKGTYTSVMSHYSTCKHLTENQVEMQTRN